MSEFIYIYIYTVLQNTVNTIGVVLLVASLVAIVAYIVSYLENGDVSKLNQSLTNLVKVKIVKYGMAICLVLVVAVPSNDDMKTIIAGGFIWKGATSVADIDGIDHLPKNIVRAMNIFLSNAIKIEKDKKEDKDDASANN